MTRDLLTYVRADGVEVPLTEHPALETVRGMTGRLLPPLAFTEDPVPGGAGSRTRSVRDLPRELGIPVTIRGDSRDDLRANLRSLASDLYAGRGDGVLRITAPSGDVREVTGRFVSGLEGAEASPVLDKAALVFRAPDPYWQDGETISVSYSLGSPTPFFPFFPLTLAPETVFGTTTVDNDGDVPAWPVWTIVGPGTSVVLSNDTTGESLTLTYTLASGEAVVIDTRPGAKTVTLDDGSNLYGSLDNTSTMWALAEGSNTVSVTFNTSTVDSYVSLAYRRRYLAA